MPHSKHCLPCAAQASLPSPRPRPRERAHSSCRCCSSFNGGRRVTLVAAATARAGKSRQDVLPGCGCFEKTLCRSTQELRACALAAAAEGLGPVPVCSFGARAAVLAATLAAILRSQEAVRGWNLRNRCIRRGEPPSCKRIVLFTIPREGSANRKYMKVSTSCMLRCCTKRDVLSTLSSRLEARAIL